MERIIPEEKIIGVDIGGTKIHLGLVQHGTVIREMKIPTSAQSGREQILNELIQGIQQFIEPDVLGIGVGVPGLVDEGNGVVFDVQNIPDFTQVPLKKCLEDYFAKPTYLTNDANSFILGEKLYGRAQPFQNVVGLTLGTGLGGGIITNNQLYSGAFSAAGEFGCIPYRDKTLEDYCSGKFFINQFGISGPEIHARAIKNDPKALTILHQFGEHLGEAIKIIMYVLAPEAIFLGGSVSTCYPYFKAGMQLSVARFPFAQIKKHVIIERSRMNNGAILGAAALVYMKSKAEAAKI
ncbi:ROK family protein [Adhaeribacter swui]|uniref:ROK family protein n=1 Tax=Adhaeribacter swui TaxID=2086471 RepID=A0A7G7GBI1_9BACT|nr:ROK family protein [Adhaeribacter swui]QNF34515.1 ROK family protein [Adhaeribacter swui]